VTVIPTAIMNAEVSIYFIDMALSMLGRYGLILKDSGPYFILGRLMEWPEEQKVKQHIATLTHTNATRCCERFVCTFQQSLVKLRAHTLNWQDYIIQVVKR
jgi:hypothetical protein